MDEADANLLEASIAFVLSVILFLPSNIVIKAVILIVAAILFIHLYTKLTIDK